MKHNWDHSDYGKKQTDLQIYGRRICLNCGKEQVKVSDHVWMRVTGYRWQPLVGKCKGHKK